MTNATCLRHALSMSAEINKALADLDADIANAVNAAKAEGLPQGLIVAVLHGQVRSETARTVN